MQQSRKIISAILLLWAAPSWAWDPNEGAEPLPVKAAPRVPSNAMPARFYSPAVPMAPQTSPAAMMAATPAPAVPIARPPVPAAPVARIAPPPVMAAIQAPPSAPAPAAMPQPVVAPARIAAAAPAPLARPLPSTEVPTPPGVASAMPAPLMAAEPTTPTRWVPTPAVVAMTPAPGNGAAPASASKTNRYRLGAEGYYDEYREPSVGLADRAKFASLTGGYEHYFRRDWYGAVDLRASRGEDNYKSPSGSIHGITQWDSEARLLGGYDFDAGRQRHFRYFSGLGAKYFYDASKGEMTDTGARAYDRRILQFYVPIGMEYGFNAYGLRMKPSLEGDILFYGLVNSRLEAIPGYYELNNQQREGTGVRGDFMISSVDAQGRGWEFGPFFRYWNIPDSGVKRTRPTPSGTYWIEPENERMQAGVKVNWLF